MTKRDSEGVSPCLAGSISTTWCKWNEGQNTGSIGDQSVGFGDQMRDEEDRHVDGSD